jgi:hypothetical protein
MNTDSDWARSHTDAVLLTLADLSAGDNPDLHHLCNLWNLWLGFPCFNPLFNLLPGTLFRWPVSLSGKGLQSVERFAV